MTKPKLAIAADHAGINLKTFLIEQMKEVEFIDMGTNSTASVDYPDFAEKACRSITSGLVERAILVCGSGIGVSIAANKIKGIRAAHVESSFTARLAGEHNGANVLCLGERVTGSYHALECARAWLNAQFEDRHQKRLDKIHQLEK